MESSNIAACLYFRKSQLLLLEFQSGRIYGYRDIPWSVYLRFRRASSHGRCFSRFIRDSGRYPCQELDRDHVRSITGLR